ncbi:hypothetical protein VP018_001799 [Morganella morganii]|nr:hypothetical protein [Morganella morganii]
MKKIHLFIKSINTRLAYITTGLCTFLISTSGFGIYNIAPGEMISVPINTVIPKKIHPNPTGSISANANTALFGAFVTGAAANDGCNSSQDYKLGWSTDKKVYGFILAKDVILGFTGNVTNSPLTSDNTTITGEWFTDAFTGKTTYSGAASECWSHKLGGYTSSRVMIKDSGNITINGNFIIYAGPKAKFGSYYPRIRAVGSLNVSELIFNDVINIDDTFRDCTVSTDNTITFPPADITSATNGQVLANKTGSIAINCNDDSDDFVSVEIQGPKGRYSDTMALTMTDGTNAPAEIRGFIGSDIPLNGQCNGRLDGYNGIVYFIPNAGLEKISLKPGTHKYNWVLCSTGAYKTGKATGSAKMVVNWD